MNNPATLEQEVQSLARRAWHFKCQMEAVDSIIAQQGDRPIGPAANMKKQRRWLCAEGKKAFRLMDEKVQVLAQRRAGQADPTTSVAHDDSAGLLEHAGTSVETSARSSDARQGSAGSDEPSSTRKRRRTDEEQLSTVHNTLGHGDEAAPAPAPVNANTHSAGPNESSAAPPAVATTLPQRSGPSAVHTQAPAAQTQHQQAQRRARNLRFIRSLAEGQLAVDDPLYWTIVREGRYLVELHCPDSMCRANCRKTGTERQNGESTPVTTFFKGAKGLKGHVTSTYKWQGWAGISEAEVARLVHKRRLSDDKVDAVFHRRHAQFQVEACLPYKRY